MRGHHDERTVLLVEDVLHSFDAHEPADFLGARLPQHAVVERRAPEAHVHAPRQTFPLGVGEFGKTCAQICKRHAAALRNAPPQHPSDDARNPLALSDRQKAKLLDEPNPAAGHPFVHFFVTPSNFFRAALGAL